MRAERRLLWLNLDAELELQDPVAYTPSAGMRKQIARHAKALQRRLAHCAGWEQTLVLHEGAAQLEQVAHESTNAMQGLAWCPTPRALEQLGKLGVQPALPVPLDVLQHVNHRRFCAELGQSLPGAQFVTTMAELEEVLQTEERIAGSKSWLLKRPFGFSGRARKRISAGSPLSPADRAWAQASMQGYGCGLQVEPWVEILREFSMHGFIDASGKTALHAPLRLRSRADGSWHCAEALPGSAEDGFAGSMSHKHAEALYESQRTSAQALLETGYQGPFGIDAYLWRAASGHTELQARSEINARYTMAIGLSGP